MDNKINSPFKFLDAYEWEDRKHFFGRDEEIDKLYEIVFEAPLLLVYGMSGTGKTSLVQCGLSSRFDGTDWFPFFVRHGNNLVASLHEGLNQALPDDSYQSSIAVKVTKIYHHYLRPVYLIFDQFEELFILGEEEDRLQQQQEFAELLRDLLDSELPCKVILIMREEFLAQLYSIEQEIPTIYDHRLRVEPMGFPKIKKVIKGSADAFNIELADAEIKSIYQNVSSGKFGVQLPYLQVYLDGLYRKAFLRQYPELAELPSLLPKIIWDERDIVDLGKMDNVLASFLLEQEERLEKEVVAAFPDVEAGCVRKVLNGTVTRDGTKKPLSFVRDEQDKLLLDIRYDASFGNMPEGVLSFIVGQLMNTRLLRERDAKIELAHDSLAVLIDGRRSENDRKIEQLLQEIEAEYKIYCETNQLLDSVRLDRYLKVFDIDEAATLYFSEKAVYDFIVDSMKFRRLKREVVSLLHERTSLVDEYRNISRRIKRKSGKRWNFLEDLLLFSLLYFIYYTSNVEYDVILIKKRIQYILLFNVFIFASFYIFSIKYRSKIIEDQKENRLLSFLKNRWLVEFDLKEIKYEKEKLVDHMNKFSFRAVSKANDLINYGHLDFASKVIYSRDWEVIMDGTKKRSFFRKGTCIWYKDYQDINERISKLPVEEYSVDKVLGTFGTGW